MPQGSKSEGPDPSWPDEELVEACLAGNDLAWKVMVAKFKNLVFSLALDYGVPADETPDLFQTVWLAVYDSLPKLRKKTAIRSWLISLTLKKCYHWQKDRIRRLSREVSHPDADALAREVEVAPDLIEEHERDQLIRESIFELPSRCQEMIRLLFFSWPPKRYREVAEQLELATGSIGFIRGRCLTKLRKILVKKGI